MEEQELVAKGPLARYMLIQCDNLSIRLPDKMRGCRNCTKVTWTTAGGIGKLPFISVALAWAGKNRPVLGWFSAVNNQLVFLAIDWTFISLILNSELRERSPEELEVIGSTTGIEKARSASRIGLSILGAEFVLFPQAYAAKVFNPGKVCGLSKGWISFTLGLVGPLAFTTYSVYASLRFLGRMALSRKQSKNPTERRLRELKGEMLGKLQQTRSALIQMKQQNLSHCLSEIEDAAASNDLSKLMSLVLDVIPALESNTSEIELESAPLLPSKSRKTLKQKCKQNCTPQLVTRVASHAIGAIGMLGQLTLVGFLSYQGGGVVARSLGGGDTSAVATGVTAVVLTTISALKLAWDGIMGSAVGMGEASISHISGNHSLHYRLMPRLTIALNLCDIALMALVWVPVDELARTHTAESVSMAVEASSIIGLVILALGGVRFMIDPIVRLKVRASGTEEEKALLGVSTRLQNIQQLLQASPLPRFAELLHDRIDGLDGNKAQACLTEIELSREQLDSYLSSTVPHDKSKVKTINEEV